MPQCGACESKTASMKCKRCELAFYCDAKCQRAAWPAHKGVCKFIASQRPPPSKRCDNSNCFKRTVTTQAFCSDECKTFVQQCAERESKKEPVIPWSRLTLSKIPDLPILDPCRLCGSTKMLGRPDYMVKADPTLCANCCIAEHWSRPDMLPCRNPACFNQVLRSVPGNTCGQCDCPVKLPCRGGRSRCTNLVSVDDSPTCDHCTGKASVMTSRFFGPSFLPTRFGFGMKAWP